MGDFGYILLGIVTVVFIAYAVGSFLTWVDEREDRYSIYDVFDDDDQDTVG